MWANKIKKLLVMSKEEIFFRIAEQRIENREQRYHVSGKEQLDSETFIAEYGDFSSQDKVAQKLFDAFWSRERDRFFTELYPKEERVVLIKKHLKTKEWLVAADRICAGRVRLLGHEVDLAGVGEWHTDPLEGCEWPRIFYNQVSRSKPSATVDIKYVWEMNRHQYLIVLGKAYWISGDEKYAEKMFGIIASWIEDNPYHCGVNWTSSLELAVRSISWIWAYFLCRDSKRLDPDFHYIFLKSIYEHGRHMAQHLSYYSSPYNHLIGEAAGLHLIGSLFPELKTSQEWERLGWSILEEHIEKQFFDDGMCVEQATFYHHFTLGFYLQSILLRKSNKKLVTEKVLSIIEKALEVSMYLTKPDGTLPAIGDIDNARSLYFNAEHSWDFRSFLSLGAVLFNRSDFKTQSNGVSEEMLWLCDEPLVMAFETMDTSFPEECSKALSSSGYYVMRDGWERDGHYLCFDCGDIAAGLHEDGVPSAAHGHADALSFELSVFGKPILSEGGFYTYFGDLAWHRHFREESAHSTIKIGQHRQAEYCGRLTWKSVVNPKLNYWRRFGELDSVCGEICYDKETRHRREIVSVGSRFWILSDQLQSGSPDDLAVAYFHFDGSVTVEIDRSKKQVRARNGEAGLLMQYFSDYDVEMRKGGNDPESGWQAQGYGYKTSACVLSFKIPIYEKMVFFPMVLFPWRARDLSYSLKGQMPPSSSSQHVVSASFSFNEQNYTVSFSMDESPSVLCDGVAVSK